MTVASRMVRNIVCIVLAAAYVVLASGSSDPLAGVGPVASVLGFTLALAVISERATRLIGDLGEIEVPPLVRIERRMEARP